MKERINIKQIQVFTCHFKMPFYKRKAQLKKSVKNMTSK